MKKSLKTVFAAVMASAMLFTFASCAEEEEDGPTVKAAELPASAGTNVLSENTFVSDSEDASNLLTFKNDTYTKIRESTKSGVTGLYDDYIVNKISTYKYTYNAELGVIYSRITEKKTVYIRNGEILYTVDHSKIPATVSAYMDYLMEESKAIVNENMKNSITIDMIKQNRGTEIYKTFKKFGYTDTSGMTEIPSEIYAEFYKYETAQRDYSLSEIIISAYSIEGDNLKITENVYQYPEGFKFSDIFNGTYYFHLNGEELSILLEDDTFCNSEAQMRIRGTAYKILSVSDNSITIAPETKGDFLYEVNNSAKVTIPLTYEPGTNKTTANFTYEGNNYSFDIDYFTSEHLENMLASPYADTYTKWTPVM